MVTVVSDSFCVPGRQILVKSAVSSSCLEWGELWLALHSSDTLFSANFNRALLDLSVEPISDEIVAKVHLNHFRFVLWLNFCAPNMTSLRDMCFNKLPLCISDHHFRQFLVFSGASDFSLLNERSDNQYLIKQWIKLPRWTTLAPAWCFHILARWFTAQKGTI